MREAVFSQVHQRFENRGLFSGPDCTDQDRELRPGVFVGRSPGNPGLVPDSIREHRKRLGYFHQR